GKRLGILGLGAVGMAIAKRAANGFDMSVSYHNRQHRSDVSYNFCSTPTELARASDFLIIATPGGLATKHLINRQVLDALGPKGFVVNIARASVVVTADLISALEQRRIAGAALDVFDAEPQVPDALKSLTNVVLTPHVAGLSPEATQGTVELVGRNLVAFFSGQPVLTPVELPSRLSNAVL
ncbi:hydroxyacid dehydrogenase, partial [Pseudomonas sp. MWU12-2312b]